MLRDRVTQTLKEAMKAKDELAVSTLRLVNAAIKDREIANRSKGRLDEMDEAEILAVLQAMIKQRNESIDAYRKGNREDLAAKEAQEIEIIQRFLPKQMNEAEIAEVVQAVIAELDAKALKDMGRTMAALKERYPGCMDFTKASAMVKARLG